MEFSVVSWMCLLCMLVSVSLSLSCVGQSDFSVGRQKGGSSENRMQLFKCGLEKPQKKTEKKGGMPRTMSGSSEVSLTLLQLDGPFSLVKSRVSIAAR